MVVVHPALDVPQAGRDSVRDLCVRRGKGEMGIVRIAVVRHAMRGDDRTKRPSVQREEREESFTIKHAFFVRVVIIIPLLAT